MPGEGRGRVQLESEGSHAAVRGGADTVPGRRLHHDCRPRQARCARRGEGGGEGGREGGRGMRARTAGSCYSMCERAIVVTNLAPVFPQALSNF